MIRLPTHIMSNLSQKVIRSAHNQLIEGGSRCSVALSPEFEKFSFYTQSVRSRKCIIRVYGEDVRDPVAQIGCASKHALANAAFSQN